ncbi:MAG: AMP-binding protein, partial [bacterium]|nr:AMP-binding protein [bacterium]
YLNNPDFTAEKFIANPFIKGTLLYETGDIARWLPGGDIEFRGRVDHQVKIRGFRIQLEEIETQLRRHDKIKEAVVMVGDAGDGGNVGDGESGSKYIYAYIAVDKTLDIYQLKAELAVELPDYMIPAYIEQIDQMPLTPNGKVDRRALTPPEVVEGIGYTGPRDNVERKFVEIWSDILGIDKEIIGIDSNFFQLGGHSLKTTILSSKLHKEFHVKVPMAEVFRTPTIRQLAQYIQTVAPERYAAIQPAEKREYYALSSAQKRLFIIQRMNPHETSYNIPDVWWVEGSLDRNKFEETFKRLMGRHESFRTYFRLVDEEPFQVIHENCPLDFVYNEADEEDAAILVKNFLRPFDLFTAPLLRVKIVKLEETRHMLMIDMHHIISDGMSMGIFVSDFMALYSDEKLPALRLQYKDFSQWHNKMIETGEIKKQEAYWLGKFKGDIPQLDLPIDFPRTENPSREGEFIPFEINETLTGKVKALVLETKTTLNIFLLTVYYILLSKYHAQEDVIIGTGTPGRPHADLENITGMFVNMLVLRNYPLAGKNVTDFLSGVKKEVLDAYENQDYQFDELVTKLGVKRELGRNPLFDAQYTFQPSKPVSPSIPSLILKPYKYGSKEIQFDL